MPRINKNSNKKKRFDVFIIVYTNINILSIKNYTKKPHLSGFVAEAIL
tara:strand:- start:12385 stop:12528 length:144 start_codon:yes stop_codon:yes gene_type:complete